MGAAAAPLRRWTRLAAGMTMPLVVVAAMLVLVRAGSETAAIPETPERPSSAESTPIASIVPDMPSAQEPEIPERDLSEYRVSEDRVSEDRVSEDRVSEDRVSGDRVSGNRIRMTVAQGDSLGQMFRRHDLNLGDLHAMVELTDATHYLRMLSPGNEVIVTHDQGRVRSLEREIDDFNALRIERTTDNFSAALIERPVETLTTAAHGIIERSLFEAAQDAGIAEPVIMEMAEIFQWDIDFLKDVRTGDEFTVIYEQLWRDGEKLKDGTILAAEFINQGMPYRAARHEDGSGVADYFTPEGRSVRKAFIRAPVDFTRISSTFSQSRLHPILNTIRPHRGVDYAAPSGTPVRAAGDGTVSFRGSRNGFGNTVVIRHGGKITTLYAHLSRFAEIQVGSRVQQGQTIGYVGMTGMATGPHLHYEYQVDGVHRDPQTASFASSEPVYLADAELVEFQSYAATLWRRLDLHRSTQLRAFSGSVDRP